VPTLVHARPAPVIQPKGSSMSISLLLAGYDIGSGRTVPTVAAVVGLISVVIGGLALPLRRS
jgi:hypothetical protein